MAGELKTKYGPNGQILTITLASLADAAKAESVEVDNATNLYRDAPVQVKVKTGASGVSSTGVIRVFAVGSVDGGTTYPDSANNTLHPVGIFNANGNDQTFISNALSVANAFGGNLPEKWKLVVQNDTGVALNATGSNHEAQYQGIYGQYT